MIQHMVLINFKKDAAQADIDDAIQEAKNLVKIEGLSNLTFGKNLGNGAGDFAWVLSMHLPDMEYMEKVYQPHPVHQKLLEKIRKVIDTRLGVDFAL